jgi:hypothetical protein
MLEAIKRGFHDAVPTQERECRTFLAQMSQSLSRWRSIADAYDAGKLRYL